MYTLRIQGPYLEKSLVHNPKLPKASSHKHCVSRRGTRSADGSRDGENCLQTAALPQRNSSPGKTAAGGNQLKYARRNLHARLPCRLRVKHVSTAMSYNYLTHSSIIRY